MNTWAWCALAWTLVTAALVLLPLYHYITDESQDDANYHMSLTLLGIFWPVVLTLIVFDAIVHKVRTIIGL